MKTKVIIINILIGIVSFATISCSSPINKSCTPKYLIEESINAINNKNTKEYVELIDYKKSLELWKQASEIDKNYLESFEIVKNKDNMFKGYSMSYNMLIGTIEKIHKLKKWEFDVSDFELVKEEKLPNFVREEYKVNLIDNKKTKWNIFIYLSKYKDCYYITEPVEHTELYKN